MKIVKTYKFKLYRSKKNKILVNQIKIASSIYNHSIALHKRYYKMFGKHLPKYKLQKHLTKLKKIPRYKYWNKLGSQAVQDITDRIDRAYRLFFRNLKHKIKTSPPGFKSSRKYRSFTLKQAGYNILCGNRIKIGDKIYKYSKSREIEGKIKTLTVKQNNLGELNLCFSVEGNINPIKTRSCKAVERDLNAAINVLREGASSLGLGNVRPDLVQAVAV